MANSISLGLDIGSTTIKLAAVNGRKELIFSRYERHFSNIKTVLRRLIREAADELGNNTPMPAMITGSGGLLVSEWLEVPFIQEVVAV